MNTFFHSLHLTPYLSVNNNFMKITANSIKEYLNNVPKDRKEVFDKLYRTIKVNIPDGFQEELGCEKIIKKSPLL